MPVISRASRFERGRITMSPISIDEYQGAVRDAVCNVCVCFKENQHNPGRCIHETSGQCSLFAHLGEVVDVMSSVQSNSMEAYTDALRAGVCTKCDHHDDRGVCNLRDSHGPLPTWCTL